MRATLFITAVLISFSLTACMKKKKISTAGLYSNVQDPSQPTPECPNGADFIIEAVGKIPPVFDTGTPVTFKIDGGTNCKYGYKITAGPGMGTSFRRYTYASSQYTAAFQGRRELFTIAILGADRQPVRDFEFESEPFEVKLAAPPSCTVNPAQAYLNSDGRLRLGLSVAQAGSLETITSSEQGYLMAIPSLPRNNLTANQTIWDLNIYTQKKSGTITFGIKDSARNLTGSCSVNVINSDCDRYLSGDFLGEGGSSVFPLYSGSYYRSLQSLHLDCDSKAMIVTGGENGTTFFGTLTGGDPRQLIAAQIDSDAYTDLLVVREAAGKAVFQVNKSTGSAFTQITCSGDWTPPAGASLPLSFELKGTAGSQKIVGRQNNKLYEAALSLNGGACAVAAVAESAANMSIAAFPEVVDYNQPVNITWSAQNVDGYTCKLEKCDGTDCSDGKRTSLEQNLTGNQIVQRTFQVANMLKETIFQSSCVRATPANTISQQVRVGIRSGSGPSLLVRLSTDTSQAGVTYFAPNYPALSSFAASKPTPVYLSWNFPNSSASSCSLLIEEAGKDAKTEAVVSYVQSSAREISGPASFKVTCGSEVVGPIRIKMLGSPVIQSGTVGELDFKNKEPNASEERILKVQANSVGEKIKIDKLRIVKVDKYEDLSPANFTVTGCEQKVLIPGETCDAKVKFTAGTYSQAFNGYLAVEFKRYDDAGVELVGSSAYRPGFKEDRIAVVKGNTRAQICEGQGKGKPQKCR